MTILCRDVLEQNRPDPAAFNRVSKITGIVPFNLPDYFDPQDIKQYVSVNLFEAYGAMGNLAEQPDSPVTVADLCNMHNPAGLMRLSAHEMLCELTDMFESQLDYLWRTYDLLNPLAKQDSVFAKKLQQTRLQLWNPTLHKHGPQEVSENIKGLIELVQYVCDYYQHNPDYNNPFVTEGLIQLHNQIVFCAGILAGRDPRKWGEELFVSGTTLLSVESKQIEFERIFTIYTDATT